jgi:benzoyl-CoA reductase/2-hydroxyglutaryl-CoA dehydratase subunit BcrC/BadD/HgdB
LSEAKLNTLFTLEKAVHKMKIMEKILKNSSVGDFIFKRIFKPLAFKKWNNINKSFRFSFMATGGGVASKDDLEMFYHSFYAKRNTLENLINAVKTDQPIVWIEWSITREILKGFDIFAVCPESFVRIGYAIDPAYGLKFIEESEKNGYQKEGCSSQQGAIGAIYMDQLPKPAAIIAGTHPCDSGVSVYQTIEYITKAPLFILETPYLENEDTVRFYCKQIRSLIGFLEEKTGRTFDWERFKNALTEFNRFSYHISEVSRMGMAIPCPYSILSLQNAWELRGQGATSQAAVRMSEKLYVNTKRRFDKKQSIVKKEKIRVLWWDVPVQFIEISSWMAEKFGAVIVMDYISRNVYQEIDLSTEDTMIEGLAKNHIAFGMRKQCHGPIEYITDELENLIEEYSPDCCIFSRHIGCKHNWAAGKLIKDVCKKSGLPSLYMSIDIFDPRECSEEQVKDEIEKFFISNGFV